DADDDAGNDSREKEPPDGGIRGETVDYEYDARRNDRSENAGGEHHGRRERYRVALIAHRLDDDDAKSGKIGERSARNAGEYHLRRDRDLCEAAAHPPEHVAREIED